jgi:hypothetical protein
LKGSISTWSRLSCACLTVLHLQVLRLLEALLPSVPSPPALVCSGNCLEALAKHAKHESVAERMAFMLESPKLVATLGERFLPLLHQIYSVQSSGIVRSMVR